MSTCWWLNYCDFWEDNKLKRYLWCCNYTEKRPHENTQDNLSIPSNTLSFPVKIKKIFGPLHFLKSTAIFPFFSPCLPPQFSDTLKIPASWWGTNCFHKEPEASFLRFLSKISGLLCSTQGLGVYTLIFFNSCKKFYWYTSI